MNDTTAGFRVKSYLAPPLLASGAAAPQAGEDRAPADGRLARLGASLGSGVRLLLGHHLPEARLIRRDFRFEAFRQGFPCAGHAGPEVRRETGIAWGVLLQGEARFRRREKEHPCPGEIFRLGLDLRDPVQGRGRIAAPDQILEVTRRELAADRKRGECGVERARKVARLHLGARDLVEAPGNVVLQPGVGPVLGEEILADAKPVAVSRLRLRIFLEAGVGIAHLVVIPGQLALQSWRGLAGASTQHTLDFPECVAIAALGLEEVAGEPVEVAEPDQGFE